jgi:hypothetical protein
VYLLGFHTYINKMHGSRTKIPSKNLVHIYIYIHDVKFLALLGAIYIYIYIYDISRLRVNVVVSEADVLNLRLLSPFERE